MLPLPAETASGCWLAGCASVVVDQVDYGEYSLVLHAFLVWNSRPVFGPRARAKHPPTRHQATFRIFLESCGRRGDSCLKFVVVAVGGDAGGCSNHADNQDLRLLPKNPIGFDGDDAAGRGHVRVCMRHAAPSSGA